MKQPVQQERAALHAYLDPETRHAWTVFAEENGVSVTGLLEALGHELAEELAVANDPTDVRQDWVRRARKIDMQRRRRRGR